MKQFLHNLVNPNLNGMSVGDTRFIMYVVPTFTFLSGACYGFIAGFLYESNKKK